MAEKNISSYVSDEHLGPNLNGICYSMFLGAEHLLPIAGHNKQKLFDQKKLTEFVTENKCLVKCTDLRVVNMESNTLDDVCVSHKAGIYIEGDCGISSLFLLSGSLNASYGFDRAQTKDIKFAKIEKRVELLRLILPTDPGSRLPECLIPYVKRNLWGVSNPTDAKHIVETYGPFFYKTSTFGALFSMSAFNGTENSKTSSELSADLNISFSNIIGNANANLEYATRTVQNHCGSESIVIVEAFGGDPTLIIKGNENEWFESAKLQPAIIGFTLRPIYDLVPYNTPSYHLLKDEIRSFLNKIDSYNEILRKIESNIEEKKHEIERKMVRNREEEKHKIKKKIERDQEEKKYETEIAVERTKDILKHVFLY